MDMDMDGKDEIRYRPNSGFGEFFAECLGCAVLGFAIGWGAFFAYGKWPDWGLVIGLCSVCGFVLGVLFLITMVAGTWVHVKQCLTLMRLNRKEVERRSIIQNNQNQQINED